MAEKKKAPISTHSQAGDKKKALETCIAQIEKNYGKGAIMRLGDDIPVNVEALSTGSLSLDLALGIGGVPKGRIIEIYGPEASGKTTPALHVVAAHKAFGYVQRLLSGIGLRNEQTVDINAECAGVSRLKGVLNVDKGNLAAQLLGFSQNMQGQGGFTGRFRSVYFDNSSLRITTYS